MTERTGELEGKVALVTGGGGGIGSATAKLLAVRGASVVVADLDASSARTVAEDIQRDGGAAVDFAVDVSDEEQMREMAAKTGKHFGAVDILHNNAMFTGVTDPTVDATLLTLDVDYWDQLMAVNLRGYALGVKHFGAAMVRRGSGVIVNTASAGGLQGDVVRAIYGTSKAGIIGLTMYVAAQFGRFGVRCVGIAPGFIVTPTVEREVPIEMRTMLTRHQLLPQSGRPDDIAELVAFVASDRGSFITGTTIAVDGGFSSHAPTYADTVDALAAFGI
jgi:NAD(P)-dependent dehydrogenase (short-subunit alcohol dehydrogenase family)